MIYFAMLIWFCLLSLSIGDTEIYTFGNLNDESEEELQCHSWRMFDHIGLETELSKHSTASYHTEDPLDKYKAVVNELLFGHEGKDPLDKYKAVVNELLFGHEGKGQVYHTFPIPPQPGLIAATTKKAISNVVHCSSGGKTTEYVDIRRKSRKKNTEEGAKEAIGLGNRSQLVHYPSGNVMRSELFYNQRAVHLPITQLMHRGQCRLRITSDHMQTAVNAFAILVVGSVNDVLNLPSEYVLRSARTISMIKLPLEKFAAVWTVVKNGRQPQEIPYTTLEMYRPLFKYINGREMARLNLSDNRILSYIGTHADLNRHQVGVVASRYIKLNPNWMEPRYLNLMNNLLCGVPMTYMRKVPPNTYLQLTHQVFYHIKACDPLQRRFYLTIMTKTQALGKSFSWSARDVSHLGLLLAEVEGPDLSAINPAAMSGITAQVMLQIPVYNLLYFTEPQLRHIGQKPLTILTRKLKHYQHQLRVDNGYGINRLRFHVLIVFLVQIIIK